MLKYVMFIDTLTQMEQMMIEKFILLITNTIHVEAIYLFGSRARIEGHKESDIDIAIIVKNKEEIKDITQMAIESSIKIEEELGVSGELILSPIVIDESMLKTNFGIARRIKEEGALLWSRRSRQKKKFI
ncbi:MAG: nucleotidyltransferase domain-containing protein [Thermodesulfovibrionales bacterium]